MAEYKLSYTAQEIDEKLSKVDKAVLYTEQTLTEDQKAQARENIGAVDNAVIGEVIGEEYADILAQWEKRISALEEGSGSSGSSGGFESVADMKKSASLKVGDVCCTNGYYAFGDGGGAKYAIVSEADESTHQEQLANGLYATLIHDGYVNVKWVGAYGDGSHNDALALQKAFDIATKGVYIPPAKYIIRQTILIENKQFFTVDAENTELWFFNEEADVYCFKGTKLNQCIFRFGSIWARHAGSGCLELYSSDNSTRVQYVSVYFRHFFSDLNCVYMHTDAGWVAEVRFFNGRVSAYSNNTVGVGFKIECTNRDSLIDHITFRDVGIEGIHTGFHMVGNEEKLQEGLFGVVKYLNIVECRTLESFTTFLKTEGNVYMFRIGTSCILYADYFDLSTKTYGFIEGPCAERGGWIITWNANVASGIIIPVIKDRIIHQNQNFVDLTEYDPVLAIANVFVADEALRTLKLTKQYGTEFGHNKFVVRMKQKNASGFEIYDCNDKLICDGSTINNGDVVEFEWFAGSGGGDDNGGWVMTKLEQVKLITPPYSLPRFSHAYQEGTLSVSSGNHIVFEDNGTEYYRGSRLFLAEPSVQSASDEVEESTPSAVLFNLYAGDVVRVVTRPGASNTSTERSVCLYKSGSYGRLTLANNIETGQDVTSTMDSDFAVGEIYLYKHTKDPCVLDVYIEIYVNGVRYV